MKIENFDIKEKKNYVLSNGLGGYASTSIMDSCFRHQHGYLIASFKSPVERYMLLKRINETVVINGETFYLEVQEYDDNFIDNSRHLKRFQFVDYPIFTYEINGVKIVKKLVPVYESNSVYVKYEIQNPENKEVNLTFKPLFNFRDHGENNVEEDFNYPYLTKEDKVIFNLPNKKKLYFKHSNLEVKEASVRFSGKMKFAYDYENGPDLVDVSFTPLEFNKSFNTKTSEVQFLCGLEDLDFDQYFKKYKELSQKFLKGSLLKVDELNGLVKNSMHFISQRHSTKGYTILAGLPWFADWGRDTFIAFTGITLVNRQFEIAKSILKSFASYEKKGLIPNMFPEDNSKAKYNTIDGSLLFVNAVYKYYKYSKDLETVKELLPVIESIVDNYTKGTSFKIKLNKNNLISGGSDDDQLTWMDVFSHGIVVTPRHSECVEINALFFNALKVVEYFYGLIDKDATTYSNLSDKVKEAFNKHFIKADGTLYDCLGDEKVRPNQLYAAALPFKIINKKTAKAVVTQTLEELHVKYALRTLSYKDKDFKPHYTGSLFDRDMAYHMGTSWPHLFGLLIDSIYYAYDNKEARKIALPIFKDFLEQLNDGSINSVAEVFDGIESIEGKGCFSQAWGVAETLRSYYENIIKKR